MSKTLSIALIGPGLVGSEFLAQVQHYQQRQGKLLSLNIVGIATSKRQILSAALPLATWKQELESKGVASDLDALAEHCIKHSPCVIVDSTSNASVASKYTQWLKMGINVVTPNKKAFSADLASYHALVDASRNGTAVVYHESTVGAGLPLLSTLNDLVETGDEIIKIEGIFSGTLSYIFNQFSSLSNSQSASFSAVVATAKRLGYTEPDPRDDLNGMDVARKVVILGRLAGLSLSLDTLSVENIVPQPLQQVESADAFMSRLPEFDAHFEALNKEALESGSVLRYVGVVDAKKPEASSVKLVRYDASHPFASLKGSDNIVAFTTKRFPNPLIIQGAGAGAAVTAFGMFSDILKVSKSI